MSALGFCDDHAARRARAAWSFALVMCAGCQPSATLGTYTDVGVRCEPLGMGCDDAGACTLRSDPAEDACRSTGGLALGTACSALDACVAGSQCAVFSAGPARIDPAAIATGGTCARVCARDAPACGAGERCVAIRSGDAVRVDYGVCGP